ARRADERQIVKGLFRAGRVAILVSGATACQKAQTAPLYEAVPVARRDIVVTASAAGVVQPILTFSVKSKAWGEIIEMPVQTGDEVRAPITGSILELDAVLRTVISSPTLGGGTVILKTANLDTVQDSAMVAETDIGRVQPGLPVTITVDAFPNRTFDGTVLKIGPQAQIMQNVTSFPVFVNIPNPGHLLKPGMNTEVRIHTGRRDGVLAVPYAAL